VLLTIAAAVSAQDLGYLLHKNPARLHTFEMPFGSAHVFYPEAGAGQSKVALLLDVDPVGLVRGKGDAEGTLDQYVNDRPYVCSSFLSVALARVCGTAMGGRSRERPELAELPLFLEATLAVVACRGGEGFLQRLFGPLGYELAAHHHPLDEQFPEWGESPYYTVRLRGCVRLRDLLTHLYVLVPVLDDEKHYWVGAAEVEKLLRKGAGWLAAHPERELIAARYLRHDRQLTRNALARLADEDASDPEGAGAAHAQEEQKIEAPLRLWEQRIGAVLAVLRAEGAASVVDVGSGEGKLLHTLLDDRAFTRIMGMDVSWRSIEIAGRRLKLDKMPTARRKRIELIHGSLLYRDRRLSGFDAATVIEVIEHLDPPRLAAFERVLFEHAQPRTVVVTTPNVEYNRLFAGMREGALRHRDHRFEWTRAQFAEWAEGVAGRFGYKVRFLPVGPEDAAAGAPTQMGVFTR
jgi:3' terminal RNA ribose 2'-O-methyltransferase Hen1